MTESGTTGGPDPESGTENVGTSEGQNEAGTGGQGTNPADGTPSIGGEGQAADQTQTDSPPDASEGESPGEAHP